MIYNFSQDTEQVVQQLEQKIKVEYSKRIKIFDLYVRYVGSIDAVRKTEVQIGNCLYQLGSVTSAVDLAFKAFKVFQKPFPVSSLPCWKFLEENVYKFDTNYSLACTISLNEKLIRIYEDRKRNHGKENTSKNCKGKRSKNSSCVQNKSLGVIIRLIIIFTLCIHFKSWAKIHLIIICISYLYSKVLFLR